MLGGKRRNERQEPRFDSHPEELLDIRLTAADRSAA
jgi:hypothetical protein